MTLLDLYLRAWQLREQGILTKEEHDLYGYLLYRWNSYGKQNPFSQSTQFICDFLKISKKSLFERRNSLMQKGLIDFENGERNSFAAKYVIVLGVSKHQKPPPKGNQNHPQKVTKTTPEIREDNNTSNEVLGASEKKSKSIFQKPTIEEIAAYCAERKNDVNPQKWFNHYTANGWKVGRNPMKDWRASVRTWETNEVSQNNSSYGSKTNQQGGIRDIPPAGVHASNRL